MHRRRRKWEKSFSTPSWFIGLAKLRRPRNLKSKFMVHYRFTSRFLLHYSKHASCLGENQIADEPIISSERTITMDFQINSEVVFLCVH